MMLQNEAAPIMRKISSRKNLSPRERERLNWLKGIFRREGRIPLGTSLQEMRYLLRLEAGRKRYRWRKRPSISERKEWEAAMRSAYPSLDRPIEEIFASMSNKNAERSGVSEK